MVGEHSSSGDESFLWQIQQATAKLDESSIFEWKTRPQEGRQEFALLLLYNSEPLYNKFKLPPKQILDNELGCVHS